MTFKSLITMTASAAILLTSCHTTTQLTSGTEYLSRYNPSLSTPNNTIIDAQIREIAAIEPDLRFPARIGLARIERGRLTTMPAQEMRSWGDLSGKLGAPYGEFVPVSPFIANMVRPKDANIGAEYVVQDIRRASARQHLDYVLTYEVNQNISNTSNAPSLADLTILGLYVLPSRNIKIDTTASAILIDVRNGYPYGTATAYAKAQKAATALGSGHAHKQIRNKNFTKAVENLAGEVETMMKDLWIKTNS